jgi:hypothetical protein
MAVISPVRPLNLTPGVSDSDVECLCEVANGIRRRLRDIRADEAELGQRATSYLVYEVLRRGWNQC